MRVLHLIGEMGTGGAERLVAHMCSRAGRLGWVSAVASAGGAQADLVRSRDGTATYDVPVSRRRPAGVARSVLLTRAAVLDFAPDVVLAHNVGVTAIAAVATRPRRPGAAPRPPVVTVFHGVAAGDLGASVRIVRTLSDRVVTVSRASADRLERAGLPAGVVTVIPNAVDVPPLDPTGDSTGDPTGDPAGDRTGDRAAARAGLGLPADVPVAVCVARLVQQKRHDVLLRAWAAVPAPAVLLVVGDGPLHGQLARQVGELGLTDRVRLLGPRDDVPRLLAAADVSVLSSDWEGLPMSVLESLAAGRPVVATDVDGVREAVDDDRGRLVPPDRPDRLAAALRELLSDGGLRERLGAAGRAFVTERHDLDTMMRAYDDVLRGCLPGAGPQRGRGPQ